MWIIKDQGVSWDGWYFREKIISDVAVILSNPDNVLGTEEVILLHGNAPGWTANAMQEMLREWTVDFKNKSEYPGNSPDLNACEDVGSILKQAVQAKMIQEEGADTREQQWCVTLKTLLKKWKIRLIFLSDYYFRTLAAYKRPVKRMAVILPTEVYL